MMYSFCVRRSIFWRRRQIPEEIGCALSLRANIASSILTSNVDAISPGQTRLSAIRAPGQNCILLPYLVLSIFLWNLTWKYFSFLQIHLCLLVDMQQTLVLAGAYGSDAHSTTLSNAQNAQSVVRGEG